MAICPHWRFLTKLDGFRAVAYVDSGTCRLVSRNRNAFKTCDPLAKAIGQELPGRSAILDGEIVHPGTDGRPMFFELMRRSGPFCFYAFDLLWLDDKDLRGLPLIKRKRSAMDKLRTNSASSAWLITDSVSGRRAFRAIIVFALCSPLEFGRLTPPYATSR
jgi:bifunctional non-homologous end joining protein LigD